MYDVHLVLQQVAAAFYNASLAKYDFVPHGHEPVLHVRPQSVYKIYAPVKQVYEKSLFDASCERTCGA